MRPPQRASPLNNPRVQSNSSYLTIVLLARTVTELGSLDTVDESMAASSGNSRISSFPSRRFLTRWYRRRRRAATGCRPRRPTSAEITPCSRRTFSEPDAPAATRLHYRRTMKPVRVCT
ncbi:hypothetical protein C8039_19855 [Halogeometricum sp. wsp3]|nr:hypothetical protein C8039_19855 [Halogeometricum sp. wsp3]